MGIGPEWIVVGLIIILLFGAKKLPDLARSMGKASSEFKKGIKEGSTEDPTDEVGKVKPADAPSDTES